MPDGRTALQIAQQRQHPDVEKLLVAKGAKDPNQLNKDLAVAVINDITNDVKSLIAQGADPNIRFYDIKLEDSDKPHIIEMLRDYTPLTQAAKGGQIEVSRILLEHGANPNLHTARGESALSLAREKKSSEIEQLLIEAGAKN